jgi:hypothetical protein
MQLLVQCPGESAGLDRFAGAAESPARRYRRVMSSINRRTNAAHDATSSMSTVILSCAVNVPWLISVASPCRADARLEQHFRGGPY